MSVLKSQSMFRRIFKNNIAVIFVILIIADIMLCSLLLSNYKKSCIENEKQVLTEYAKSINEVIQNAIHMSDSIMHFGYLTDNLKREINNTEEKYTFAINVKDYIDAVKDKNGEVIIYSSNNTLYENKYIKKIDKIKNADKIKKSLDKTYFIWDDDIKKNEDERKYFTFYRTLDLDLENIIEVKIFLPQEPVKNIFIVKEKNLKKGAISEKIGNGYVAAFFVDKNKIIGGYIRITFYVFTISALIMILIMAVLYIQNKKITVGFEEFVKYIDNSTEISADDIIFNDKIETIKELNVIKKEVYKLMNTVRDITAQKYESDIENYKLELIAMQSKIDLHTLYNSLSAVKYNAYFKNDETTMELADNLINYYRAAFNTGRAPHSINDEINLIKSYVRISEISRNMHYNLKINVDSECSKLKMVHMVLQPFVENSILHGLSGRQTKCELVISCRKIEDFVEIEISDNGYGMSAKTLYKLNDTEHYEYKHGIEYAYKLLKLCYGDDADLKFESTCGEGTRVKLKFRPTTEG